MVTAPLLDLRLDRFATPIGVALLVVDDRDLLRALDWEDHEPRMRRILALRYGSNVTTSSQRAPRAIRDALEAYFAGDLRRIDGIACDSAGTPFQRLVWNALREIPAGETASYGELAARIGRPRAVRAVGLANGANPVGVVVPCHRVIPRA